MNIRQLQYFIAIAENGTISEAAKKLGISQPPLSTQLRLLEEEVGVQLVERGARKIQLTDAGKLLYQRANIMVSLADTTLKELQDFGKGARGTLRVGTISSCGPTLLSKELLPDFCVRFPEVSFEIHEGNTYELLELLQNDVIELAVVRTPFHDEGYMCAYLAGEPMIAVGKEDCLRGLPDGAIPLQSLEGLPFIYYRRMEKLLEDAFRRVGITPQVICKNDDARTSLMWAQAGMGVALVPQSIFQAVDQSGMEYRVLSEPKLVTQIAVIRKKEGYCSFLGREFFQMFQERSARFSRPEQGMSGVPLFRIQP